MLAIHSSCETKAKKKHFSTVKICDSVFAESYIVINGGAFGGDIADTYFTDTINFRIHAGRYNNYNVNYRFKCIGDTRCR